jgi:hypothetical protein
MKSNMRINNDKYEKRDINKNWKDSPSKSNAENFNDHFLIIAENMSDIIKSNNSLNTNGTTYSQFKLSQILILSMITLDFLILLQVKLKKL